MKSRLLLLAGLVVLTSLVRAEPPSARVAQNEESTTRREKLRQLALGQQRTGHADGALQTWRQLIEQFPKDPSALVEAGDAMADAGRYADASSFYEAGRDFTGAAPEQQAEAITRLAQLAEVQYETDKARALYFSALPLVPTNGWMDREIRLRIDDSYRRVDDLPGLAAAWQSYLASHGDDADAVLHLNAALSPLHRDEEAVAWLRKAAEWAPARRDVKTALAAALRKAGHAQETGEIPQERGAGDEAGHGAKAQSPLLNARAQDQRGENEAALQSVRAGLENDPKNFELLSLEEALLATTKQWPQAADLAEKLVAAAPSLASIEEVEDHYVRALRQLGKQEETARQFTQRLTKGAPLSEAETRLFVGLALRNGDLNLAGEALDNAALRFPDSAELVYDRAELERCRGHLEPSVAALRRLAEMQPAQKEAWWRRIARVYENENLGDRALAAAHKVFDFAPKDPDSWAFAAGVAHQAGQFDDTVASLKEAIRLSDRPNPFRRRLAGAFEQAGRVDDERETLLAAFDTETDPVARLTMTVRLADAFAHSERLDDLIALFRERRRTAKDGWRYAVYLAEIERSRPDVEEAREELAKAWGPRSRDLLYLTESWRIAVTSQNAGDRARLARLLAEADPGTAREIELATALLRNGETVDAMKTLRANEETLFVDPMAWHDPLVLAAAAGMGEAVVGILQTGVARHADDWRLRFLLAEARLRTGDFATAEKLLREVQTTTVAAAFLPPSILPDANVDRSYEGGLFSGVAYGSGTGRAMGSEFAHRNVHGFHIRQLLSEIAAGFGGGSRIGNDPLVLLQDERFSTERYLPKTAEQAADAALVIRSVLAQQEGRGAEFAAELQATLKNQPRAERIAQYSLVQALDPLMKEIATEAAFPSEDEVLNADCFEVLMSLSTEMSPTMGGVNVDWATLVPLVNTFLQRETRPETLALGKLNFSKILKRAGREAEAQEVARDAVGHWSVVPRAQRWRLLDFALETGDPAATEKVLSAIAAQRRPTESAFDEFSVSTRTTLAAAMLTRKADDPRVVKLLIGALRDSYATPFTNLSSQSLLRGQSVLQQSQEFPYGSQAVPQPWLSDWATIFGLANEHGMLGPIRTALDQQIDTLAPATGLAARLARVCFLWWSHDRDTAIREVLNLADTRKDDVLHLLAGSMLAEAGRRDEAQKSFAQVTTDSGALGIEKLARLLILSRAENDPARARPIALRLAEFPLSYSDRSILEGVLTQLGLADKVTEIKARERARAEGAFYSGLRGAVQQLQQETQAKHQRESIDLARAILARVAPAANGQTERYFRGVAIDALRQFKALSEYTDELDQQLAKDPNSVDTLLRLAEAFERGTPGRSVEYVRRLVKLEPDNQSFQLRLAGTLSNQREADEAVGVWEAVFARDAQAIFSVEFYPVMSGFKAAKQVSRLGAILANAPARGNPLENLGSFGMRDTSYNFDEVAAELRKEGKPDEAIRVWRASLARMRYQKNFAHPETATLKKLIPALLAAGRKGEAVQELDKYFFPPAEPKPALGFEMRSTERNWAALNFGSDGNNDLAGAPVMRLAGPAGALDELRAKAVEAAATHPQEPERFLVLLIDVLRRDPTKLAPLRKAFDDAIEFSRAPRNVQAEATLRALARILSEWPEGRALALHVYEKAPGFGGAPDGWNKLHCAELALALHEEDAARQALREWISWTDRGTGILPQVDVAQELSAIDLMSRAGMAAEAAPWLKKVQAIGNSPNRPEFKSWEEELAHRTALLAGETGHAQITVWAAPATNGSHKTKVCWEIGAIAGVAPGPRASLPKSAKPHNPPLSITGQDLPALDGKFTVELFHGVSEGALHPLATIPAAKMRGTWESPEPLSQGYIIALVREKDAEAYSPKAFVPGGPNLLTNPDPGCLPSAGNSADAGRGGVPGWPDLNAADTMVLPGGPNPGGQFVRLGLLGDFNRSAFTLSRIPLEPGRSYYFAGWLRTRGNGANGARAGLAGRFLDQDGMPIGQDVSPAFTSLPGRWFSCGMRLVRTRVSVAEERSVQIPEKAAFFEPSVVTGSSPCDMNGLYFGGIADATGHLK